jgi:glucose-1-phosphate adenylyltransferase
VPSQRREPKVLVVVLAGGEGKRLSPLTDDRAKPAVPFAGSYRIIDFCLSNFANARYLKIVVLTQYKSHSLDRHISQTWRLTTALGNYVASVPAQMRRGPRWFAGSADALYQNLNLVNDERPDIVCVFGADHIYRMDPRQMVEAHLESGAGVTVAGIPIARDEASQFGVMEVREEDGRIVKFHEKVAAPPSLPGRPDLCLASMGNYVFDTKVLIEAVTEDNANSASRYDVGGDVIPMLTEQGCAHYYDFANNWVQGQSERERGYWRDVGTLDAYYDANMDLIAPDPVFNLYNSDWPVYTYTPPLPPAKMARGGNGRSAEVIDSLLCQGSIVSGARVERSIVGPEVFIDSDALVEDAILFPGVVVGPGAHLKRCIVDKNVRVPAGYRVGIDTEVDAGRFTLSDSGIVVVEKDRVLGHDGR